MAHKFNRAVEIRSALLHLHSVIDHEADKEEAARAQRFVDVLAAGLGQVYGLDFSNLEEGDSYGEIEYLRWAVDGCQNLLGYSSDDEMEEGIKLEDVRDLPEGSIEVDEGGSQVDSDGFCNSCGDQLCEHTDPEGEFRKVLDSFSVSHPDVSYKNASEAVFYRTKEGTDWKRCGVKSPVVGDFWERGVREVNIEDKVCVLGSEEDVMEELHKMRILVRNFPHIQKDIDRIWKVINEK